MIRSIDNSLGSDIFVVESDRIRNVNDAEFRFGNTDIDNVTSTCLHKGLPAERQCEVLLGLKSRLRDYNMPIDARHRKPFTILDWGNEFFADYQPHNSSVFSMFDDLSDIDDCTVNYYVLGFHHKAKEDPFFIDEPDLSIRPTWKEILEIGHMQLDPANPPGGVGFDRGALLESKVDRSTRAICHGALRKIRFRRARTYASMQQPAIDLQQLLTKSHPVAVGTNIMDALLAYLRVRFHEPVDERTFETVDDTISKLIQLIIRTDHIEAQQKAQDEISTGAWINEKAELMWTFSNSDDAQKADPGVVKPSDTDQQVLRQINGYQASMDASSREIAYLRHKIFTRWWKAMEAEISAERKAIREKIKSEIANIVARIKYLNTLAVTGSQQMEILKHRIPASLHLQTAGAPTFGINQDPSILFAGVKSGWPSGFQETLTTRHSTQLPEPDLKDFTDRFPDNWEDQLTSKFPLVSDVLKKILPEVLTATTSASGPDWPSSSYADLDNNQENFKNTQGWFPLFMEWEVEYYHIQWEHWKFVEDRDGTKRYKLRDDTPIKDIAGASECRKIHGRTMFIPQASQSLKTRIQQLFDRIHPADRKEHIREEDQAKVLKLVSELEYFSSPLSGIREHMLTLMKGGHVSLAPYDRLAMDELGMDEQLTMDISEKSELAPYGKTQHLPREYTSCPFKPVTHGQFRFTRLDIVDKFGQVVNAIEPAEYDKPATALYPCLSRHFLCDPIPQKEAFKDKLPLPNTAVIPGDLPGVCQFFQVPPRINQPARLNGSYVIKDGDKYRSASPWENPIWGWILVNFADHSLQIFNADGKFVQEIFVHPDDKTAFVTLRPQTGAWSIPSKRLSEFIALFSDYEYALGFFQLVSHGSQTTGSNPSEHSDLLPAAFGDVLCLVDFGISLELAGPAYENQSSQISGPPEKLLTDYQFNVSFGNSSASYDGTIGYFDLDAGMKDIYTNFGYVRSSPTNKTPVVRPKPTTLTPYYLPPETPNYSDAQDTHLHVWGGIVDPFRPIHVYTGDLCPMKELSIPKWALDKATKEMHAFFQASAILVPSVPDLNRLSAAAIEAAPRENAIQMPLSGLDEWNWLHPKLDRDQNGNVVASEPSWKEIPVKPNDTTLNLGHSANMSEVVDGYFIMKKSLQEARA